MSRFALIPFTAEDYLAMVPRQSEAAMRDYKPMLVQSLVKSASASTLTYDGTPIVSGGIFLFWPGVAELWLHGTEDAVAHPIQVFRTATRLIAGWVKEFKLHRVQITVDKSFEVSSRFVKMLGFHLESHMAKYGPNAEPFLRYVYFPEKS